MTRHIIALLLIIKLNNYFILFKYYHFSSNVDCFVSVRRCPLLFAANTSVDRRRPPSSTAIAQRLRLPWLILDAGAC
jgi:hypothetical protein